MAKPTIVAKESLITSQPFRADLNQSESTGLALERSTTIELKFKTPSLIIKFRRRPSHRIKSELDKIDINLPVTVIPCF